MGVKNLPLKNPMDNPEEWVEQVMAELSSIEPDESVADQVAEQAAEQAVKQVQEQAGDSMADIVQEVLVQKSRVKESGVALGKASGDLDVWPVKSMQQSEPAVGPESAEHSMPAGHSKPEEAGLQGLQDSEVAAVAGATGSAVLSDLIPDKEETELRYERLRKAALPTGLFAHFLLIDIQAPVREMRGIPRYLRLQTCCTVIGRHAGARIFLDDAKTVEPKHARVVYEQREKSAEFVLYPVQDAQVLVNGKVISSEGVVCNSGDGVQIGSAHLIFFSKNTAKTAGAQAS